MARIRSFKPEFWQDEKLASCSPHARLLALALLQLCDANGVFRNIPMQVHAHAFPWEAEVNTPALLGELESVGYVKFYRVEGRQYGQVPGFRKHQRLSGKEAQSDGTFPLPDQADTDYESEGNSPSLHGEAKGNVGTGNREQGTGKEEQGKESRGARKRATQIPKNFEPDETCRKKAEALGLNLDTELEKFTNHAQSKGRTAKDWQAALRNWLIKAAEFQAGGENPEETLWRDAI